MNTSLVKKISLKNDDDVLSLNVIIQKNEEYKDNFRKNLLFELMRSGQLSSPEKKEKLLGYLHIWSIYFQRMMLLKTALCEDPAFTPLFYQHLDEEYGHDKILLQERKIKDIHHDAILEALSNWFFSKMLSFTPYEQLVLVNLCLEAAASIFHDYATSALDPAKKLDYLQLHAELDVNHEKMGLSLLEDLTENHYSRLLEIQRISWDMFDALMKRIAELTIKIR